MKGWIYLGIIINAIIIIEILYNIIFFNLISLIGFLNIFFLEIYTIYRLNIYIENLKPILDEEQHEWNYKDSFLIIKEIKNIIEKLEKKNIKLEESLKSLEKENLKLIENSENIDLLLSQILNYLDIGIFFIDEKRNILPYYTSYLKEILFENFELDNKKLNDIFFNFYVKRDDIEKIDSWLSNIFNLKKENYSPPIQDISFKFKENNNIKVKHFKIDFYPIEKDKRIDKLMITLKDISEQKELKKELRKTQIKTYTTIQQAIEIIKLQPQVIKTFLKELKDKLNIFEEKISLIHQGTINNIMIEELIKDIEDIKDSASILNLHELNQKAIKIKKLLDIVKHSRRFRIEHLLEIKENIEKFLELLETYISIGDKILKTDIQKDEVNTYSFKNIYIIKSIFQKYNYLQRAILGSSSYPSEIVRIMRYIKGMFNKIFTNKIYNNNLIDFEDILHRAIENHYNIISKRGDKIEIISYIEKNPVLICGDVLDLCNILNTFIILSILKAKNKSSIKIFYGIKEEEKKLAIESRVGIRNTNIKVLKKIENIYNNVKNFYKKNRNISFDINKWGFTLEVKYIIPIKKLTIGYIGQNRDLEKLLFEIKNSITIINIDILINPPNYDNLSILIIDKSTLEMLGNYIKNKINNNTILIPFIHDKTNKNENEIYKWILKENFIDFISPPLNINDIKWCLFNCIEYIINNKE